MALDESTWNQTDGDRKVYTCDRCGSVYEVWSTNYPARDAGNLDCVVCGAPIVRWDACRDRSATK